MRTWDAETEEGIATLTGHDDAIRRVSWSPDGGRVATPSNDRTGRIWNARTGAALHVLRGHDLTVRAEVRSADSRRIVTASDDCAALIWDTDHGTRLAGLHDHASSTLMRTGRTMTSGLPPPPPVAPSGSGTPNRQPGSSADPVAAAPWIGPRSPRFLAVRRQAANRRISRHGRGYSQHSPFARSSSPGYSVSLASRAEMIRPVSALVRR